MKKQSKGAVFFLLMVGVGVTIFGAMSYSRNPDIFNTIQLACGVIFIGSGAYALWIKK